MHSLFWGIHKSCCVFVNSAASICQQICWGIIKYPTLEWKHSFSWMTAYQTRHCSLQESRRHATGRYIYIFTCMHARTQTIKHRARKLLAFGAPTLCSYNTYEAENKWSAQHRVNSNLLQDFVHSELFSSSVPCCVPPRYLEVHSYAVCAED